ncbi:MAG: PAS domain S-box protein [Chloroflexi bacterium]|nr:PAS domain S-box protein [Chloroflexota bacterium]
MTTNGVRRNKAEELHRRLEKVVSLSSDEFKRIPPADVHDLICDLAFRLRGLEEECERLNHSQAELDEAQKRYLDLFDFAPVGYFNLDSRGVILSANITGSDMLNIPRGKLIDTHLASIVEPKYQETFSSYLADIARTGMRLSTELEIRRGEGTTFHAQLQTIPLYEKGKITYRVSMADITDRKHAEMALKESEQKYRDLADALPEIIFEADVRGKVTYVNNRGLASFGLSPEDLRRGIEIFDYVSPEQRDVAMERFKRLLDAEEFGVEEYNLLRKDGAVFPALVHSTRVVREDVVTGLRGIVIDITERKQAERLIEESERRFRTTLDSMMEGCLIIDRSWRYVYANDAVARQGRYTKDALVGYKITNLFPDFEETEIFAHMKKAMEERVDQRLETEFIYPDGTRRWFEVWIEPVPEGILVLYMNIDERKRAEQQLRKDIEKMERLRGPDM